MLSLSTPIENLMRVGPRFLVRLKKLGIKTIKDLLWHFPVRYEDYSNLLPISDINAKGQMVSITGRVETVGVVRSWRRHMAIVNATIEDSSGVIRAVWFNQPYVADALGAGTLVSLSGKVSIDKKGLYLSSPSYERLSSLNPEPYTLKPSLVHTGRLVPVYPETEGLTSKYLRFLIKPLLGKLESLPDPLPSELLAKYNFPKLAQALAAIHFPETVGQTEPARQRFAFEEILLFQLRALRDHRQLQALRAPQISFNKSLIAKFVKSLPFELTNDQRVAAYEILQDLERPFPMNRLLNGDVGSGKTVVALITARQAVDAGQQVVFMAPTEILARQHYQTVAALLFGKSQIPRFAEATARRANPKSQTSPKCQTLNFNIRIGLLTGSEARQFPTDEITEEKISKKLMLQKIAKGELDIIIGTHAVISAKGGPASGGQKSISFKNLGLVVIDEQHRFGVEQRMKLVKNSSLQTTNYPLRQGYSPASTRLGEAGEASKPQTNLVPHLLSMTATPIPRTLALTVYGDLDVSLIKEKPKGREKIITKVVPHSKRDNAHKFIDEQIRQGRQVFVICPRIELSKTANVNKDSVRPKPISQMKLAWAEVKAVTEEYEKLAKKIFPHRRVVMLHGRLKPKEKEEIMRKFKGGHYDILVSTSVVEVGVDVPNATMMMIESAERFGLAQLHQFRGRVGRGEHQSYCFLFTSSGDVPAGQRLRALEKTDDGFQLAEADLKLRGPGEFTGVKQSGIPDIAMSSLADIELIKKARLEARLLLKVDPTLVTYPVLAQRLNEIERLVHFE